MDETAVTGIGEDVLDGLVRRVRASGPRAGTTRVVALDGRSGSGKTTLAARLAERLPGPAPREPAPVVPLELIYPGWDGLADVVPRLQEWVLRPLAVGSAPRYRRFDWTAGEYAEWLELPAFPPVVVVEGVGSGARACAPYLSLLVWLEAPAAVRKDRALTRDGERYAPHWDRWAAQEEDYLLREDTPARAAVRIDTTGADVQPAPSLGA